MSGKRIVWILGAGFSRSLGGPLLQDLFTEMFDLGVVARLAAKGLGSNLPEPLEHAFRKLRNLYHGEVGTHRPLGGPWTDAEQFLEYVDLAEGGDLGACEAIRRVLDMRHSYERTDDNVFRKIANDARRYIVCACHHYSEPPAATEHHERWLPYRVWAHDLGPGEHVITFNYDLVADRVATRKLSAVPGPRDPDELMHQLSEGNCLLKLHGSVDWAIGNGQVDVVANPWDNLSTDSPTFAIGIPGPSKAVARSELFAEQWGTARKVLMQATHVIFVGYRMPETDADARALLVNSLRRNGNNPQARIVLGPRRDEHVERLEGILRWTLGPNPDRVIHEPMWAQDFLAVFDRDRLA